ncbi:type I Wadjet antiplasmid transformation system protein JetC [Bacillus cereus]|uniref:type I Wadjet antiplasmid transformation system protein JetC n=1 Tax=Bacillus cereus TaxID=1396 RepID=UPI0020D2783E|nr:type I Wadjet antiplasmid transformation system protein JetC [Bacillus cereus]
MKKLRLINWHYYNDETIIFGKQTVISGHTGAGKSTIIDALQVLFISDERKIKFNSAAYEEAKRSLINYLRGKIGTEEKPFVREGYFTTYIVAEFYDEKVGESFVIGISIDVFKDDEKIKEYFIIPKSEINMISFFNTKNEKRYVETQADFFKKLRAQFPKAIIEKSSIQYQKALLHRFGGLHERFIKTFAKALSFKPIDNMRDFVYKNILDEKELKIDVMRSIFQTHEELQRELEELKQRKEELERINNIYMECIGLEENLSIQEYILRGLDYLLIQEEMSMCQKHIEQKEKELKKCELDQMKTAEQKEHARKKEIDYEIKIKDSAEQKRQKQLQEQIAQTKKECDDLERAKNVYVHSLEREEKDVSSLFNYQGNEYFSLSKDEKHALEIGRDCLAFLSHNDGTGGNTEEQTLNKLGENLKRISGRFYKSTAELEHRSVELKTEEQKLLSDIENLKRKKRSYPMSVEKLKGLLEKHLEDQSKVWILCEELEIKNDKWRNALEGYLNTQRFDILVEPHMFATALYIYEKEKWNLGLEGVGLVDTEKEQTYLGKVEKGSLAEEIVGGNSIVKARIHHLLGRVIKAESEQELRKYKTAVTATCMSYQRLVARQIPRKVYETPYIGAHAIQRQLEIKEENLKGIQKELKIVGYYIKEFKKWIEILEGKQSYYKNYISNFSLNHRILELNRNIDKWHSELNTLDLSQLERLHQKLEEWKGKYNQFNREEGRLFEQIGKMKEELQSVKSELWKKEKVATEILEKWESWKFEYRIELLQEAEKRYDQAISTKKAYGTIKTKYENNKKENQNKYEEKWSFLESERKSYNEARTFQGIIQTKDNKQYEEALRKIANLDIPKFKQEIKETLQQAEEEFQSHFIYKMREAIQAARREFNQLNHALGRFKFRNDTYRFVIKPSEQYKKFYDVIMDERVQLEISLFDFGDEDRTEILKDLFSRLVVGEYGENEEFVDYRNYLDFDLSINNENGTRFMSNLLREQSGGETQTPFYIAILASFQHLYRNKNTIRLVVFDEAFNKMDEERIQISLRLIKQLDLQLIAAVPDEKMAHMAAESDTAIIINRVGHVCFTDMLSYPKEDEAIGLQEQDSFSLIE